MDNLIENDEIIKTIVKTRNELNIDIINYKYADMNQVDYFLYKIKANQSKFDYLIKQAKKQKLSINNVEKIKFNI